MRTAEYFSKMPRKNAEILARKKNAPKSKVGWAVCAKCTVEVWGKVFGADLLTLSLEKKGSHWAEFALLLDKDLEVLVDNGHSQQDTSTRSEIEKSNE